MYCRHKHKQIHSDYVANDLQILKMSRLHIDLPEQIVHSVKLNIRVTDLNYGNHLANNALLGLLHEARLDWLRSLGYASEQDLGGAGIILADAAIVFQSEAFLGEMLTIELRTGDLGRASFDLYYVVTTADRQVATAKTAIVFFDYATHKMKSMPATFRAQLEGKRP